MRWRIPCSGDLKTCQHCVRFKKTWGTFGSILGLVFVFSIAPIVPYAILFTDAVFGDMAAWLMGVWWYLFFPAGFALLTWVGESAREVSKDG
jgi:hypothetical protein